METATTHEARARNAKAQALAAVLLERGATSSDVKALHAAPPVFWEMAAFLATERELLGRTASGKVRQVHVPGYGSGDATATIDAVARILGDLIAHEADQAAIAEQVAPVDVMTADLDADTPDAWCDDDDRAEAERDCDHSFGGIWPCALPLGHDGDHDGGWRNGQPPPERPHADTYERPPVRRPTDSAGYRSAVRELDPPTAAAFQAFGQAAGR